MDDNTWYVKAVVEIFVVRNRGTILCFVFIIRFIYRLNRFWFLKKKFFDKHNEIISTLVQRCDNTGLPYLQHGFFCLRNTFRENECVRIYVYKYMGHIDYALGNVNK